jgi:hypothetical protein
MPRTASTAGYVDPYSLRERAQPTKIASPMTETDTRRPLHSSRPCSTVRCQSSFRRGVPTSPPAVFASMLDTARHTIGAPVGIGASVLRPRHCAGLVRDTTGARPVGITGRSARRGRSVAPAGLNHPLGFFAHFLAFSMFLKDGSESVETRCRCGGVAARAGVPRVDEWESVQTRSKRSRIVGRAWGRLPLRRRRGECGR